MSDGKETKLEVDFVPSGSTEVIERLFVPALYAVLDEMPLYKGDKIKLVVIRTR